MLAFHQTKRGLSATDFTKIRQAEMSEAGSIDLSDKVPNTFIVFEDVLISYDSQVKRAYVYLMKFPYASIVVYNKNQLNNVIQQIQECLDSEQDIERLFS